MVRLDRFIHLAVALDEVRVPTDYGIAGVNSLMSEF